jgi:hypothetical protein
MADRSRVVAAALWAISALVTGCGGDEDEGGTSYEIAKPGETSPPWLYEGPLPRLESPSIVTSISGHTMRVSGLLPADFDEARLPWYVAKSREGGRLRVHVVYPIATGRLKNGQWNNVPGRYDHLNVRPYRPNDPAQAGKEHWGGFPFLNYHDRRRFALHGPIDFVQDFPTDQGTREEWRLVRGRVSLGCQRMQGEHVLELTHMLGFDMGKPWTRRLNGPDPRNGVEGKWIPIDMRILAEPEYDRLEGRIIDVDYPKDATVPSLPQGQPVRTFPTWDANVMLAWACPVKPADDPNRVRNVQREDPRFDGHYCERTNGRNVRDPLTGL